MRGQSAHPTQSANTSKGTTPPPRKIPKRIQLYLVFLRSWPQLAPAGRAGPGRGKLAQELEKIGIFGIPRVFLENYWNPLKRLQSLKIL